jgi:hypothetical protein
MKLITEINDAVHAIIEEAKDGKPKSYHVEGVLMQAELKNRNGRMYPLSVLAREAARYNKDYIMENRAVGELGHPDTPTINYDRASHKFLSLKQEGNNFIGKAKILSTPMGNIVKNLLDDDVKIGMSTRGMGSLKSVQEGTIQMVQDDYYLATAGDIVADPSAPDAFVRGIMEGKEWVWDNGVVKEVNIAAMHEDIMRGKRKQLEERAIKNWEKFLNLLSNGS